MRKGRHREGFWETKGKRRCFWPACDYPNVEKKFIYAGGIRFWVEIEGKGPPLILIHGGPGGNHCYFHPHMSKLAKRRSLIYYDLRGHYMSSEPKKRNDYGLLQDTKDVEALRKALKLDKISLLGHSYGGIVAFMYGVIYPENLKHIIFCSTPVDISNKEEERLIDSHPLFRKMDQAKSKKEEVELYYKLYFHKPLDPKAKYYEEFTRKSYETEKAQRLLRIYEKDRVEPNWKEGLLKINRPMLFIYGRHDPLALPEKVENIISKLDNAKLVIFEESGHDPFVDEPEKFMQVVDTFLSSN